MTNKEKCENIKHFVEKKDVVGILSAFLIDDSYKDVDFVRYLKKEYPETFVRVHPTIIEELNKQRDVAFSCSALLDNKTLSEKTKAQIAQYGNNLIEKTTAIISAAQVLCQTFEKASM